MIHLYIIHVTINISNVLICCKLLHMFKMTLFSVVTEHFYMMIPLFWWKNMLLPRCHVDLPIGVAFHCFPSMMMIQDVLFKPTKWEACSSLARWQVSRCKWTGTNNITTKHLHVNMNTSNHHPHHYHQQRQRHHHDPHPHHCHHQVQSLFLPHHFVTLTPRCQSS